jgi:hypothetical protein
VFGTAEKDKEGKEAENNPLSSSMYLFLSLLLRPGREEGVPDCPSTNGLIAQYDALPSDCHNRGYGKRKERSFSFFLPLFLLSLSFALSPSVPRIYLSLYISSSGKRGAEIESHNTKGRLTSKAQAQVDREKVGSQQGTESVLCKKEPQTNKCERGKKRNRTKKTNMLKMTNFKKVDRQAVQDPENGVFRPLTHHRQRWCHAKSIPSGIANAVLAGSSQRQPRPRLEQAGVA